MRLGAAGHDPSLRRFSPARNPSGEGVHRLRRRRTFERMKGASGTTLPRVVDAVERVTAKAANADELLEGVATEVGKAVPYDGAMWFGVDPNTLLAVAPSRMEHLDD